MSEGCTGFIENLYSYAHDIVFDLAVFGASGRGIADNTLPAVTGISLFLLITTIAVSSWVSEEFACIGAGLMVAGGTVEFLPAVTVSFFGILTGNMAIYIAGTLSGPKTLGYIPFKWLLNRNDISSSSNWFRNRGPQIIIASRFIPGSRIPTYFAAGILGYRFKTFMLYLGV